MALLWLFLLTAVARAVPQFTIDLDEAPEERWHGVIQYYISSGIAAALVGTPTPETVEREAAWAAAVEPYLDDDMLREIDGFIKYGGFLNLTRQHMLAANHAYEMNFPAFACSGLIAAYPNGTVIHGRNLDYGGMDIMLNGKPAGWPELTIEATFIRDGMPLFTSIHWPLQLGIHTAMRFGGWSFEQNTRRLGDDYTQNLAAAQQGALGYGVVARRVMESVPDFDTAVQMMWSANLMSPQYFIMAGAKPYEGAVLAVDRFGQHQSGSPPLTLLSDLSNQSGAWHIIQTNDDLNKPAGDARRPIEELRLSSSQQSQVSPEWVFGQMRGAPIFNEDTAFTWVAIPATDYHIVLLPNETMPVTAPMTLSASFLARKRV